MHKKQLCFLFIFYVYKNALTSPNFNKKSAASLIKAYSNTPREAAQKGPAAAKVYFKKPSIP